MAEKQPIVPEMKVQPGDTLVVAGSIGQEGVRRLLEAKKEWFAPWFSPGYLESVRSYQEKDIDEKKILREKERFGITGLHAVDEGGILGAVWDFSEERGIGVSFSLHQIPIKQHVIELGERCGANPYRLWCGNCLLIAARRGWQLVQALTEQGIEAQVIGAVQEGIARTIRHGGEIGYLERPKEDELFRLLRREDNEKITR